MPEKQPIKVLGAKLKDKDIVLKSSSGGIFSYFANKVLDEGGVVFGARFDDEWNVIHDYTETKEGLIPFRKSKYVQSRIGDSFNKAKFFLKQGRKVLFTGTPCQIKSLKLFLRNDYENLLTIDIVCHGVPSPKIWKMYLDSFITEKNILKRNIFEIDFRAKPEGWLNFCFSVKYNKNNKSIDFCQNFKENIYMKAFLQNLILRPSCGQCKARINQSYSDFTIADFWGVNIIKPEFYDYTGVSLILINTDKLLKYIDSNDLDIVDVSFDEVIKYNPCIARSAVINQRRDKYFKRVDKSKNIISYTSKYTTPTLYERIKRKIYQIIKS